MDSEEKKSDIVQGNIYLQKDILENIFPGKLDLMVGVILISNTCDFIYNKLKFLTFLPIYKITDNLLPIPASSEKKKKLWNQVITLNHSLLYYLPPISLYFQTNGAVINFQRISSIKTDYFTSLNPKADLILTSTYISRLGSKVSNLFNRIPIDHPSDSDIKEFIKHLREKISK